MEEILILGGVISAVVLGLVELVKFTEILPKRYIPFAALLIGLAAGYFAYPFTDLDLEMRLWAGLVAGLGATGFFELTKANKPKGEK